VKETPSADEFGLFGHSLCLAGCVVKIGKCFTVIATDGELFSPDSTACLDVIAQQFPVPPPDMAQKHHITGWKWGRNIALLVHNLNTSDAIDTSVPPAYADGDNIIPYEIQGWQHGRRLDLEIGNMIVVRSESCGDEEEE
jgi:hypothetical protein